MWTTATVPVLIRHGRRHKRTHPALLYRVTSDPQVVAVHSRDYVPSGGMILGLAHSSSSNITTVLGQLISE
ncbi:hypothetical protein PROFUN_15810 [Planoprotostelium fungivorum]|uniref:Uncharacterized protein n=1 Tax=Planoprotostelium fungivorum TaxID=1890364 RepID=A0A2P6MUJ8_9EUKA|nr:hypothetical protein PROFUN_15810 [Planoprotostelium fungivorum]